MQEGPDKFLGFLIVDKLLSDGVDVKAHADALDMAYVGALNGAICNSRGITTLQEFSALEYVIEQCNEGGLPMQLTDMLGPVCFAAKLVRCGALPYIQCHYLAGDRRHAGRAGRRAERAACDAVGRHGRHL